MPCSAYLHHVVVKFAFLLEGQTLAVTQHHLVQHEQLVRHFCRIFKLSGVCVSHFRRKYYGDTEGQVKIPSITSTALVWGLFMGTSSNVRYQTVFGLERAVDLTIAKKIPQAAYVATIVIRFINNIIGGENFIDMARWAGVQ